MQLVAIDIGNSSTKIAVSVGEDQGSEDARWLENQVFYHHQAFEPNLPDAACLWTVCSVDREAGMKLEKWVATHRPADQFWMLQHTDIPLASNVETRTQVGRDRLVAAWAAWELNDEEGPLVLIDAGTAVTVDWVNEQGVFDGGVIFPGASTMLKNLSDSADALPDLSDRKWIDSLGAWHDAFVGKSTSEAILVGVYQMQVAAINRFINAHSANAPTLMVYATGGGMDDLIDAIDFPAVHVPDLVLRGCYSIGANQMAESTGDRDGGVDR